MINKITYLLCILCIGATLQGCLLIKKESESNRFYAGDNATERIGELQKQIMELQKELVQIRGNLPAKKISDCSFKTTDGEVKLSELFGDRDELMVIHNMGKGCSYCTLWADGFNGVAQHLNNRVPFVVISLDDPKTQQEFAKSRGWNFRMISAKGTAFPEAMGYKNEEGWYGPGVSTFRKNPDGTIEQYAHDGLGPGDPYCNVWHMLDLLPKGRNDWHPKFEY